MKIDVKIAISNDFYTFIVHFFLFSEYFRNSDESFMYLSIYV